MKLKDKVAIITGATSGIGRAIALEFVRQGAKVTLTGRNAARLAEAEKEVKAIGGVCLSVQTDILQLADIDKAVEETVEKFGRLDVLVNAAGLFETCDFLETSEELFDRAMDINLKGLFFMTQRAAKEMKQQGRGKVINFSSIGGGAVGFPTGSAYCATKGAIVALTQTLGVELAPYKINVNAICPGNVHSPMNEHLFASEEYTKAMLDLTPWGRIGETSDITPAVVYLASDDSNYVTGQKLIIDGGWSCP